MYSVTKFENLAKYFWMQQTAIFFWNMAVWHYFTEKI